MIATVHAHNPQQRFAVTFFRSLDASDTEEQITTLDALADIIRSAHATHKAQLPLLSMARYGRQRTPKGSLRHAANLLSVTGVEADYDQGEVDREEAALALREAGIACIIYTTPRSRFQSPRWRVLAPLSHEHPPDERGRLLARLNGVLGGIVAPESFVLSQSYYYGQTDETEGYTVEVIDGLEIDTMPGLDAGARWPQGRQKAGERSHTKAPPSSLGFELHSRRMLTQEELTVILSLMPNGPEDETPWRDRDDWQKLGHAIAGATGHAAWARELFVAWTAQNTHGDIEKAETFWDTLNPALVRAGFSTIRRYFDAHRGEGALDRMFPEAPGGETSGYGEEKASTPPNGVITARPFTLKDARTIPMRDWLYGRHLIRKFVSCTIAPGGIGKSTLKTAEAIAMAAGRGLLGEHLPRPLKVWLWNLEDPQEETERKIGAIAAHYGVTQDDVDGRLWVNSGRETPLCIAEQTREVFMVRPEAARLREEIMANGIDVVIVDPFVRSHRVPENDNNGMDGVVAEWGRIAEECGIAVDLVHHTRKSDKEITAESARGGGALIAAARDVQVLNQMTKQEAERLNLKENHRLFFKVHSDKMNLAPPAEHARWYRLASVDLQNGPLGTEGDQVGVPVVWTPPDIFEGISTAVIAAILDALSAGLPDGSLYARTRVGRTNNRWAGQVVVQLAVMTPEAAQRAINRWIEAGLLLEGTFETNRKTLKGIRVNASARAEMGV